MTFNSILDVPMRKYVTQYCVSVVTSKLFRSFYAEVLNYIEILTLKSTQKIMLMIVNLHASVTENINYKHWVHA